MLKRLLLRSKEVELLHPESPGMKVRVTRTWIGRLFKDPIFATLKECLKAAKEVDKETLPPTLRMQCPVCSYYLEPSVCFRAGMSRPCPSCERCRLGDYKFTAVLNNGIFQRKS